MDRSPPPNLQSLVQQFGGYDRIPFEAWATYDRDLARWRNLVAIGGVGTKSRYLMDWDTLSLLVGQPS
jgi:hypothetical protein